MVNILGFAGHVITIKTTQLYSTHSTKAAVDNAEGNAHGSVSVKLYRY